jgi:hypoxanthine phosphoribosyltransferase
MNKRYINDVEHKKLISNIVREIAISDWRPDYVVGITRGGLMAATMISHYFNLPMNALKVSLRDGDDDCESNLWMAEDAFHGKNILIVDDINDSGNTINWIMKDWPSGCLPNDEQWSKVWNNNVRFAVVIDNTTSKANIKMDYIGEEITKGDNDWIVFPYESWWA